MVTPWSVLCVQVTNYDFNYDGKNDRIQIQLSVTDMPSVVGCNILLEFVYGIEVRTRGPVRLLTNPRASRAAVCSTVAARLQGTV